MMKSTNCIFYILLICFSCNSFAAKNIILPKDTVYGISCDRHEGFNSVTVEIWDCQPVDYQWIQHNLIPFMNIDTTGVNFGIRGTFVSNEYRYLIYEITQKQESSIFLTAINTDKRYPPTLLINRKIIEDSFSYNAVKFEVSDSVITIRKSIIDNGFPVEIQESFILDSRFTWIKSIPQYMPLDSWIDNPSLLDVVLNDDGSPIEMEQSSDLGNIPKSLWDGQYTNFHNYDIPELKKFPVNIEELQTMERVEVRLKPEFVSKCIWYLQNNVRSVLNNSMETFYMYRALGIYEYKGLKYLFIYRTTGFGVDYFLLITDCEDCMYPPLLLIAGDDDISHQLSTSSKRPLIDFSFYENLDVGPILNIIHSWPVDDGIPQLFQKHWLIYPEFHTSRWSIP